jgi:hypothetical protein
MNDSNHISIDTPNISGISSKNDNKNSAFETQMGTKSHNDINHIPFWSENPNILFQRDYIFEFFPVDTMTYTQKLNAITRSVLLLTLIGILITKSVRIIFISALTMGAIYLLYTSHKKTEAKENSRNVLNKSNTENFENPAKVLMSSFPPEKNVFDNPTPDNPLSNVLITDYDYNPKKKPALPAGNPSVGEEILEQAKRTVIKLNPDQPEIADKLFKDLGDKFLFEQSLQPFYSTANTTIPNDQTAFAEFCYGSMVSCKEGNLFACARDLSRYTNY